ICGYRRSVWQITQDPNETGERVMASAALAGDTMLEVRNPRTGQVDFDLAVASAGDVAEAAARLRANQPAWEAMGVEARCGVMARWLGAVKARAAQIGEADAVDTGGCHTSYLQGFIACGNTGGRQEDAPKAFEIRRWRGLRTSMATVK